ncbi:MAG TPA: ACP S-malonyltransferase, partial [Steroidobacteraceae bacterium]|nr:ACP S-malonyltransferase [Steroidobacteraceae bacterium]
PAAKLGETAYTQPAMLAADIATWRYWLNAGGARPDAVAGHSLGEFAALVAAGALEFATAVRLVRERGERMQAAVPAGSGAIAAVLGLEDAAVIAACRDAAQGEVVETVNFNSPGQAVIAGHAAAVQRALEACKAAGAKRAVLLPMSVPAHSSLMQPAADGFAATLRATRLEPPDIAYWSPVDAQPHHTVEDIRALLIRQLTSPVLWTSLVRALAAAGATALIECGPGKVLAVLNRRIDGKLQCLALQDPPSVEAALAA